MSGFYPTQYFGHPTLLGHLFDLLKNQKRETQNPKPKTPNGSRGEWSGTLLTRVPRLCFEDLFYVLGQSGT